jgi:hypothetical protein
VKLSLRQPTVVNYIMGAVAVPVGFDRVSDIRAVKDGIELVAANGKRARAEVDLAWLGGPDQD